MSAPVMILAGGTGGHIFPGLALARELRGRGVPVVWLGARGGMETRLVPEAGFELDAIAVRGVRGKGIVALALMPLRMLRAVWQARAVLRRHQPRAVISFGGFAAGPGGLCARLLGRPLLVHEQNRAPGLTNRVLARLARRVLCGFPGTNLGRTNEFVGNPVREEILRLPPPEQRFAARTGPPRLLVLGGSQGARSLNLGLPRVLNRLARTRRPEVWHQCGERHLQAAVQAYADAGLEAKVQPFITDMAAALGWADLVLCRAGALTLAELCAAGVGAVLVPYPAAVDDHQTRNAEALVEQGAARLVPEGEDFEARVESTLDALFAAPTQRLELARAARAMARPDAARRVADACLQEAAA